MIYNFIKIPINLNCSLIKSKISSKKKILIISTNTDKKRYVLVALPHFLLTKIIPIKLNNSQQLFLAVSNKYKKLCFLWKNLIQKQILCLLQGIHLSVRISGFNYRVDFLPKRHLQFTIGKSHSIICLIPNNISLLSFNKKDLILTFFSFNHKKLNDFGELLRNLQVPNVYSQKGIFLIGEKLQKKKNVIK